MGDGMQKLTGANELRAIVNAMNCTPESFNDRFTAEQLVLIGRAYLIDETVPYPSDWTERQITEALAGKAPRWDHDMKPVY